jgi:hypothetical protein
MSRELNGVGQVFVQPYPPTGSKFQVTTDGGAYPMWSEDGKQLYYQVFGNAFFAVDFHTDPPSFGKPIPVPLNGVVQPLIRLNFDSPDGKRWVVVVPDSKIERTQKRRARRKSISC